jgi:FixJ family two-component response regulator
MKTISENVLLLAFDDDQEQLEIFDMIFKERNVQKYVLCYTKEDFYKNLTDGLNFCIIDQILNDTTGVEVTKEVKRRNKDNYVMVHSGIRDFDVVVDYINAGADRFVKKSGDINNPEFIESIKIGFIEAQERINQANELAEFRAHKEERLEHYTNKIIDIIDGGTKK